MAVCVPEGFSDGIWEVICKIPCSDVLLRWVSEQLINQDVQRICELLSVNWTDFPNARSDHDWEVFSDVLSTWLEKRCSEETHLSDLIHPLAVLNVKNLSADSLFEKTDGLQSQGGDFQYNSGDGGDGLQSLAIRSDSGIGESIFHPMLCQAQPPVQCTDYNGVFRAPIQEEEKSLKIYSQLVTGAAKNFTFSCPDLKSKTLGPRLKQLRGELRGLQNKFASLIQRTYNDLADSKASVESLRIFLTQKCVDEHNEVPHFSKFTIDIMKKLTFEEIFAHLSRIGAWHFLSYLILKDILDHFHDQITNQKLISQIERYEEEIEKFKEKTLLIDFLAVWGGRCDNDEELPCCRSVIVQTIGDPCSVTIADACNMACLIAGEFSLTRLGSLGSGSVGSIFIKWLVYPAATKHMLKAMKSVKVPNLLRLGVLQLAVERTVFKSEYQYESLYELSMANPRLFWGGVGAKELVWRKHSREVFTHDKKTGAFHWFRGAELNVSENCLDQHVKHSPDKTALIWERDDQGDKKAETISYSKLLEQTCRVANMLKKRGIKKGDVVVICMPTMPLAVASMLACARIGAIHCVVYSDFNDKVLRQRIKEVKAKGVITADIRVIGGKTSNLKEKIVKALSNGDTSVEFVLVAKRSDTLVSSEVAENNTHSCSVAVSDGFYFPLEEEMQKVSSECDPVPMDGEDILFIAYTSGSQSGTSKAVYHTQAGYLLYTKLTYKFMFNPAPDDIMACVSDLGWIAAHSYVVYGPLSNGNTTLLFESTATYPDKDRYWKMVQNLKLTHFYTVPSVLKELRACKDKEPCQITYDLSTLKVIASGGEPIPPDIEQWYYKEVGKERCLFLDTWGQTELGGTGIVRWEAPEGNEREDFPVSKSFALFGVDWDKSKERISELYLKQPIPGMGKFVLTSGDMHEMKPYEKEHFKPDGYSTSDIVEHEQNTQLFRVKGRKERTLFLQGVWLSLTEVEDCLRVKYSGICDAQVINCQDSNNESGSLCVVLQTPSATAYENKDLASFYLISLLAAKAGLTILEDLKIYFLQFAESMKMYFQTATRKTSHTMLKDFLTHQDRCHHQESSSTNNNQRWQDLPEKELLKYCQDHSSLAVTAH